MASSEGSRPGPVVDSKRGNYLPPESLLLKLLIPFSLDNSYHKHRLFTRSIYSGPFAKEEREQVPTDSPLHRRLPRRRP
jgi:hypothetical protein